MKMTTKEGTRGQRWSLAAVAAGVLTMMTMPCDAQRLLLFVAGDSGNPITYYDATTGAEVGQLAVGRDITQDTNGYFYASLSDGTVRKYNPSLTDMGTFSSGAVTPVFLHFASNGNLFVTSSGNGRMLEYNSAGTNIKTIYTPSGAPRGITTNPNNGRMLVATTANTVEEYAFVGGIPVHTNTLVTTGSGSLSNPGEIRYGPNGNLFIASSSQALIGEYNGVTGAHIGNFTTLTYGTCRNPLGLSWHPETGNLFITSTGAGYERLIECNGTTGAFINSNWGGFDATEDPELVQFYYIPPTGTLMLIK
ncbi:MAG: hypothetical protein HQ523_07925 [Lentisphaerae bacterium]|nr:hypothetical protein [Lentisphaerota bacterium]